MVGSRPLRPPCTRRTKMANTTTTMPKVIQSNPKTGNVVRGDGPSSLPTIVQADARNQGGWKPTGPVAVRIVDRYGTRTVSPGDTTTNTAAEKPRTKGTVTPARTRGE